MPDPLDEEDIDDEPTGEAPRAALATTEGQLISILAESQKQQLRATLTGFEDNSKAIREMKTDVVASQKDLGDRIENAVSNAASGAMKVGSALIGVVVLVICILGAIVGVSTTLADGTTVEPHKEAAIENAAERPSDGSSDYALDDEGPERESPSTLEP